MSSDACVVVIGPAGTLPALTQKTAALGDVLAFADADARKVLETIAQRKPAVFVLERLFAATPRGAALINRVKADPALTDTEIRVIAHDSDYSRVSPRKAPPEAQPLDQRRRRQYLTDARAVDPDQRPRRPRVAGQAAALADPFRIFLALLQPPIDQRRRQRHDRRGQLAIDAQRHRQRANHAWPLRGGRPAHRRAASPR